jgi:class 3 adenylate cyclase
VIDSVFEEARARFDRGDRIVQFVRVGGAAVFGLVVLINGPLLGVDPPAFTAIGLGLAALILLSGLAVMGAARRGLSPLWLAYVAVVIDCAAITTLGVMAGGARTHLSTLLLVVVALNGLRLRKGPLAFAVGCATLSYLVMVRFGEVPERIDRQVVYVGILWVMGMVAAGTVEMSRHMTRLALATLLDRVGRGGGAAPAAGPTEPDRREISVVTIDLSAFSREAGHAPPEEVAGALGAATAAARDVARHHGGTVIGLGPDRLRVLLNIRGDLAEHGTRAVAVAIDTRAALQPLNHAHLQAGMPLARPAIGVHTGLALCSAAGAAGDVVDIADLLARHAGPGQTACGTRTARLAGRPTEPFESCPNPGQGQVRFVRVDA